jgi:cytochrome-b5 reductase
MINKTGQVLNLYGPYGKLSYKSNGVFEIIKNDTIITKKVDKIGMIAGGSGITPMFQLINKIVMNKRDKTGLALIYSNKNQVFCVYLG